MTVKLLSDVDDIDDDQTRPIETPSASVSADIQAPNGFLRVMAVFDNILEVFRRNIPGVKASNGLLEAVGLLWRFQT
jgi:hypothetical protein